MQLKHQPATLSILLVLSLAMVGCITYSLHLIMGISELEEAALEAETEWAELRLGTSLQMMGSPGATTVTAPVRREIREFEAALLSLRDQNPQWLLKADTRRLIAGLWKDWQHARRRLLANDFSQIGLTGGVLTTALLRVQDNVDARTFFVHRIILLGLLTMGTLILGASHVLAIRVDRSVRSSESLLGEILEKSSSMVFIKDLEGRYLMANRRFQELWGKLPEGDPVTTDEDLFPPETADLLRQHDRIALEAMEPRQFDEVLRGKDGNLQTVSVRFPLLDSGGRPYAICGISSDLGDRSRLAPTEISETVGRLLIVDDEDAVREVASAIARDLGYDVLPAENGADGLRLFEEHRGSVDIVLLDLVMPVMSGNECFRTIRSLEPDTPIIVTSGFARGNDVSRLLEEPFTWFLKKPYRRKDLAEALARVIACAE